jgi:hypothetical protein
MRNIPVWIPSQIAAPLPHGREVLRTRLPQALETLDSYQGIASAMLQLLKNQSRLQALLAAIFFLIPACIRGLSHGEAMPARLENIAEKVIPWRLNAASAAKSRTHFSDVRYARRHALIRNKTFSAACGTAPFQTLSAEKRIDEPPHRLRLRVFDFSFPRPFVLPNLAAPNAGEPECSESSPQWH